VAIDGTGDIVVAGLELLEWSRRHSTLNPHATNNDDIVVLKLSNNGL
jgi:hypothetical protein